MPTKTVIIISAVLIVLAPFTLSVVRAQEAPTADATNAESEAESGIEAGAAEEAQEPETNSEAGFESLGEMMDETTPEAPPKSADASEERPPQQGSVAGQMGEVTLEKFVPSEEISADGAVSFPVDI